jgi:UDP-3-O-[3-hydroxymyristoyl] glucosamine N-acyltransferase
MTERHFMVSPGALSFFAVPDVLTLGDILAETGAVLRGEAAPERPFRSVAPLDRAGPADISFLDNPAYAASAATSRAGACLVGERLAAKVPATTLALVCREPYRAFAKLAGRLYPQALRPQSSFGATGVSAGAIVHPEARLEQGAIIDPGAVVGPGAEIGAGSIIGAQAVIGPGVRIGRDCAVGSHASVQHALIGNRVIIHPGARLGQDGFGFAMGPAGHLKVPQIGRVIVQDDVEIGAGTCIDRGANRDTTIGEGTKVDNLVQIAHNVVIGRHCVIVAQVGIAGSSTLEDYVVLGGQVGVVGHVRIGMGAQIAATSNVNSDVPPGARWGGTPAKPLREWFREVTAVKNLAQRNAGREPG